MSDAGARRLAALRHARRQRAVGDQLAALGAATLEPADPDGSLELLAALDAAIAARRAAGTLSRARFARPPDAVAALLADPLAAAGLWAFDGDDGRVGFFRGAVDRGALLAWLAAGNDGVVVVADDLSRGLALDAVVDDAVDGSFVELERWG